VEEQRDHAARAQHVRTDRQPLRGAQLEVPPVLGTANSAIPDSSFGRFGPVWNDYFAKPLVRSIWCFGIAGRTLAERAASAPL
jgi:hypothetical protein